MRPTLPNPHPWSVYSSLRMGGGLPVILLALAFTGLSGCHASQWERNFPAWRSEERPLALSCGVLDFWISKSGKEGLGVTFELRAQPGFDCVWRSERVVLLIDGQRVEPVGIPLQLTASTQRVPSRGYLGFAFDNQTLWNRGVRRAILELPGARGEPAQRDLSQVFDGFHRRGAE